MGIGAENFRLRAERWNRELHPVAVGEQFARAGGLMREIGRTPTQFAGDKVGNGGEAVRCELAKEGERRAAEKQIV